MFVRNKLFDWPSLIGIGDQALSEFIQLRPAHDVELRVMVNIAALGSNPWLLSKEDYERVHVYQIWKA